MKTNATTRKTAITALEAESTILKLCRQEQALVPTSEALDYLTAEFVRMSLEKTGDLPR